MAFRPTPGGTASSGHGHACRTDWSVPVPASLRPWRLPLQPSHPGLDRLSPLYFSPGSLSSSVCCVCDLGRCLFPFSRWNMTPRSARAFVSSAPRCAPVATAAHAPVGALPFPARTCVGVAPSQHAPVWAWPLPQPRAQGPALPPADSHLPPGLHQVRVRQLAAGPRAVPVHWHPLGHLLPARLRRGMPPPNPAPAGHPGDRGSSFHVRKGGSESVCGRPGHHPDLGPPGSPASSVLTGALRGRQSSTRSFSGAGVRGAPPRQNQDQGPPGQSQGAERRGRAM